MLGYGLDFVLRPLLWGRFYNQLILMLHLMIDGLTKKRVKPALAKILGPYRSAL